MHDRSAISQTYLWKINSLQIRPCEENCRSSCGTFKHVAGEASTKTGYKRLKSNSGPTSGGEILYPYALVYGSNNCNEIER